MPNFRPGGKIREYGREGGPERERTGINRKAQHPTNQGYCYYETPLTTHCLDKLHTVKNRDGNRIAQHIQIRTLYKTRTTMLSETLDAHILDAL